MNYTFNISPERLTLAVLLALSAGWALGQWWRAREIRRSKSRIRRESREIILDAKRVGQATIANAEIEAKGIINTELDRFNLQRGEQLRLISEREQAIARRMDHLSSIETELSENRIKLEKKEEELKFKNHELSKKIEQVQNELQSIAGITFAEARNHMTDHLRDSVRNEIQEELGSWIKQSQEKVKEEAITLLLSTSERISRSVMAESFITVVPLAPEMKGRIIGRDGRNIRAFEAVAGVDLVLDDTSDSLVISSHNPERRVKAQMTLEKLFEDGRIQPTRIEEFYKSTEAEFISNTCSLALQVATDCGVTNLAPEIIKVLGTLYYRTSYSQSILSHLKESSTLARILATELNLDSTIAARAALLHDIGKGLREEFIGPHAIIGAEFLSRNSEDPIIVNAVAAHHGEVQDESIYCILVRIADSLSGGRYGARKENIESQIQRLENMEKIVSSVKGVDEVYVMRTGAEIRVIVRGTEIKDEELPIILHDIKLALLHKLEQGREIKIDLIREQRISDKIEWR